MQELSRPTEATAEDSRGSRAHISVAFVLFPSASPLSEQSLLPMAELLTSEDSRLPEPEQCDNTDK